MPTKRGPLYVQNPVPIEDLMLAENPASTNAMVPVTQVDAGAAGQPAALAQQGMQQQVQQLQAADKDTLSQKAKAAWESTYTGGILDAMDRRTRTDFYQLDPNFNAGARAVDLLNRLGLPLDDSNIEFLSRAGTEDDLLTLGNELAEIRRNEDLLARHGGWALASGMLDPVTLTTDIATLGLSKAFTLGRIATGLTMGAGATGATAIGDAVPGRDMSVEEYVLNAALTAGVGGLLGGSGTGGGVSGPAGVRLSPGAARIGGTANNLLSETDKLAATVETHEILRRIVDDPVRRGELFSNDNAASYLRWNQNVADGLVKSYDDALTEALRPSFGRVDIGRAYLDGRWGAARDELNNRVAQELLRRDAQWGVYGNYIKDANVDPVIAKLADLSDEIHGKLGEMARDAGMRGFEDFQARPGYFHRSYNDSKIRRIESESKGTVRRLLALSAYTGIKGIDKDEADAIAGALLQRIRDKASNTRSEFLGALGKADTAFLRESLERAKVEQGRIDSIMARVEQKASDQGTIKYGKHRLTLDMGVAVQDDMGRTYRMTDILDMDLDRVMENYASAIAGRSALAKAGVGGDDAALEAYRRDYIKAIASRPQAEQEGLIQQWDSMMADFTGNRPDRNILSPMAQRWSSLAGSTMLVASGMWQVAEYATMAYRHGVVETGKEFVRQFPGVKTILGKAAKDPDLAEELDTTLGLDLARDVRVRQWKRQHDAFLASTDTLTDRVLHYGKQLVPFLNGMKYVHSHQSRMNANLVLNKFARAAKGDEAALAAIREYAPGMDWNKIRAALERNVTYKKDNRNALSMNWDAWEQADLETVMNAALRMMDDTLLYGRTGQNTSFSRSAVGQLLGQFRSFVAFAHNKLLRGTLHHKGPKGLATLLAFQYPATFLMVSANEARKGDLDLSEKGMKEVAKKAIGYTAGLGFVGDAAGIVGLTGGRGGISTPVMGLFDAPMRFREGIAKATIPDQQGETHVREGSAEAAKALLSWVPVINAFPATSMVLDAWKGDDK